MDIHLKGNTHLYDTPLEMFNVHRYHPVLSNRHKENAISIVSANTKSWSTTHFLVNRMIYDVRSYSPSDPAMNDAKKTIFRHLRAKQFNDASYNEKTVYFRQNRKVSLTRFRVDVPVNGSVGVHAGIRGNTADTAYVNWLLFKAYSGSTGKLWQCEMPQLIEQGKNYIAPSLGRSRGQVGGKEWGQAGNGLTECISKPMDIEFSPGEHLFEVYVTGNYMSTPHNDWGVPYSDKFNGGSDTLYPMTMHIYIDGEYVTSQPFETPWWSLDGWGGPQQYAPGIPIAPVPITFNHSLYPGMAIDTDMWGDWGGDPTTDCKVWSFVEYVCDYDLNGPAGCNPVLTTTEGSTITDYSTKCTIDNVSGNKFGTDRYLNLDTGTLSLFEGGGNRNPGPGFAYTGTTEVRTVGTFPIYTGRLTKFSSVNNRPAICHNAKGPIWSMPAGIVLEYQFGAPADPDDFAPSFAESMTMALRYDSYGRDSSCSFSFFDMPTLGSWADILFDDFIPNYRDGITATSGKYNQ